MSDARWLEVEDDVAASVEHFCRSIELFEDGGFAGDDLPAYRARMAFMHAMQSGHTSLESAIVRVLVVLGETLPTGADWHQDLIRRAGRPFDGRPALLPPGAVEAAHETRRFRHVATRSYGSFDPRRAGPAVQAARLIARDLPSIMQSFRRAVDG